MSTQELNEMLIIIADDDPDDIGFLTEALKDIKINCRVISVHNGVELLDLMFNPSDIRWQGKKPDLIILDINMHIMDGLQALETIRKAEELKKLPVYILSTSVRPDHQKKASELGARKYYKKPALYSDLKSLVKEVVDLTL